MKLPSWSTPERQAALVELFKAGNGFCVHGEGAECPKPVEHCYEIFSEEVVHDWIVDAREARSYQRAFEKRRLHALGKIRHRGPWDTIRREEFLAHRPVWSILAFGISAVTMHRVAKVKIPGLHKVIWVDISGPKGSKNSIRKAARYGGQVPQNLMGFINAKVSEEVRSYRG